MVTFNHQLCLQLRGSVTQVAQPCTALKVLCQLFKTFPIVTQLPNEFRGRPIKQKICFTRATMPGGIGHGLASEQQNLAGPIQRKLLGRWITLGFNHDLGNGGC